MDVLPRGDQLISQGGRDDLGGSQALDNLDGGLAGNGMDVPEQDTQ